MMLLRMAARNIFRSRRRSLITVLAMAFAAGMMIVYTALMDGLVNDMKKNALMLDIGNIQIHQVDYRKSPSIYKKIDAPEKLVKKIEDLGYKATYRLYASGLVAFEKASVGVSLRGVDPKLESSTLLLSTHVGKGKWLDPKDPKGVVIGRAVARSLKVGVGDEIVFVSQAADGSVANELYNVRGILKSIGAAFDRSAMLMNASAFRELMVFPEGAHEIVVSGVPAIDLDTAAAKISALAPGAETLTWMKINPALSEMLALTEAYLIPTIAVIYLAIAMVILNAMLMVVFERIREYGVMRAVGVGPGGLFTLVLGETVIMTVVASIVGILFGLPLSYFLQNHGIDFSSFGDALSISGVAIDPVWRADLSLRAIYTPVLTLFLLSALAAVYPAIKAALLNPIDAMRHH